MTPKRLVLLFMLLLSLTLVACGGDAAEPEAERPGYEAQAHPAGGA